MSSYLFKFENKEELEIYIFETAEEILQETRGRFFDKNKVFRK